MHYKIIVIGDTFAAAGIISEDGDDSYYTRVTTRPPMSSEGGMVSNIKAVVYRAAEGWSKGMEAGIYGLRRGGGQEWPAVPGFV